VHGLLDTAPRIAGIPILINVPAFAIVALITWLLLLGVRCLRGRGIVPEPTDPAPASAAGGLLLEFVGYLTNERGLAAGSIAAYRHLAELFLAVCAPDPTVRGCGLKRLEAQHINTFILTECARRSIGSTKNLVNTLRVLMRFLHLEGYTTTSLVESVPRAIL